MLILACLLAAGASALAGSYVTPFINPSADAFVTPGSDGSLAGNNYGGAGALAVSAPGSANGVFDTVMQFDFSGVESELNTHFGATPWTVQLVTLQLTAANPVNPIFNASVAGQVTISWMQSNNWAEGVGSPNSPDTTTPNAITYNSFQTLVSPNDQISANFYFSGATSGTVTVSFAPTPGLLAEIADGGLGSFYFTAGDNQVSMLFNSRSFPTTTNRPELTLTAVPEPGAGALLAVGLTAIGGRFRGARARGR